MIALMKFYYRFLFSNLTIIILLGFQLITILGLVQSSGVFLGYYTLDMGRAEFEITYIQDAVNVIKAMIVLLSVFVTMLLNSNSCHNLSKYLVDRPIIKVQIFFSKMGLLILTVLSNLLLFFMAMILISNIATPYGITLFEYKEVFIYLCIQSLFYLSLTNVLLSILPNIFVSFIPIVLFWYMELHHSIWFDEHQNLAEYLYRYILNPIFVNEKFIIYSTMNHYLILIGMLILGNSLYVTKKDIL